MAYLAKVIGGSFSKQAEDLRHHLSKESLELLDSCFQGLDGPVEDVHTHIGGTGIDAN